MPTLRFPLLALMVSLVALAACGDGDAPALEPASMPAAVDAPPVAAAPDGPIADVTLTPVGELMEYEQKEIVVRAGQTVRLTFTNTATSDAMHHNVVVLAQGADPNAVGQAAMSAADSDYIPADFTDQILAHTAMSAPGETVTVEFTAPDTGDYVYICTFPGHYMMMKGTMRVVAA